MVVGQVDIPLKEIAAVCRKFRVRELSVFGSALRDDFRPESDVDLLVDFLPDSGASLFEFCALRNELSDLIGIRVDLVTKQGLKPCVKLEIGDQTRVIYAA